MGYNGSNRGRSNRGYKGFSKSSMKKGNSLLFGRNGLVSGLFDIGSGMVNDVLDSTMQTTESIKNTKSNDTAWKCIIIFIVLILIVIFVLVMVYAQWLILLFGALAFGAFLRR